MKAQGSDAVTCGRCLRRFVGDAARFFLGSIHTCPHGRTCEDGAGELRPGWVRAWCLRCDERHAYRRGERGEAEDRMLVLDFCGPERAVTGGVMYGAAARDVPMPRSAPESTGAESQEEDADDAREARGMPRKAQKRPPNKAAMAEGARLLLATLKGRR